MTTRKTESFQSAKLFDVRTRREPGMVAGTGKWTICLRQRSFPIQGGHEFAILRKHRLNETLFEFTTAFSTATFMEANSGRYRETGSVSANFPSSYNIMTATPVTPSSWRRCGKSYPWSSVCRLLCRPYRRSRRQIFTMLGW